MAELAADVARLVEDVGHVAEVLDGDDAWRIIDRISHKYTGGPCPLRSDRVVLLIEPSHAQAPTFG